MSTVRRTALKAVCINKQHGAAGIVHGVFEFARVPECVEGHRCGTNRCDGNEGDQEFGVVAHTDADTIARLDAEAGYQLSTNGIKHGLGLCERVPTERGWVCVYRGLSSGQGCVGRGVLAGRVHLGW